VATENSNPRTGNNSMTIALASVTGIGFTLMALALAIGVINGADANEETIQQLFLGGMLLFVIGTVVWGALVQPWKNFDDINVPLYHGHHHDDDHHDEESSETAADAH
jgi:hypothetical protein